MSTEKYVVFDLETKLSPPEVGWKNYKAMGISVAGSYNSHHDEYCVYEDRTLGALVQELLDTDVVAGFNILTFDIPLLKAIVELLHPGKFSEADWEEIRRKTYDILAEIRRVPDYGRAKGWTLDNVAQSNLSRQKRGHGAAAPALWQDGKILELFNYVTQDVKVERDLFRMVLDRKPIINHHVEGFPPVSVSLRYPFPFQVMG